jgi:hypothetical protein
VQFSFAKIKLLIKRCPFDTQEKAELSWLVGSVEPISVEKQTHAQQKELGFARCAISILFCRSDTLKEMEYNSWQ